MVDLRQFLTSELFTVLDKRCYDRDEITDIINEFKLYRVSNLNILYDCKQLRIGGNAQSNISSIVIQMFTKIETLYKKNESNVVTSPRGDRQISNNGNPLQKQLRGW